MQLRKILLPLALPINSLRVIKHAKFLARHFNSELIVLHVLTPLEYPAGLFEHGHELSEQDLEAPAVKQAQAQLEQSVQLELQGLSVRTLLLRGLTAREIVQTAREQQVDLIAISTHRHRGLNALLAGAVPARVLHQSECLLWTDAHEEENPQYDFAIRRVLCSLDLMPHSRHTLERAAEVAAAFDAQLTVVNVTPSVELYGPGGSHEDPAMKAELVGDAAQQIAELQQDVGTHAGVILESGNVVEGLNRAAQQCNADLLVLGHLPPGGHLGDNGAGEAIIRESLIPVLSV